MSIAALLALLNEGATLEPIALTLVMKLIRGLKGKTDADILAGDASDLTGIIATAHAEAQAK